MKTTKANFLQNGTTCHQCRHTMYGAFVKCKNQAKTKPCTIKYCRKCLLNRYGEKVEDVLLLDKWDCPKCKGVCNCSTCMKKHGHQPTGKATLMAKASGFSSVSDLIVARGAENVINYKRMKEATASPKTKKPKKTKRKGFEVKLDGSGFHDVSVTETNHAPNEKKQKKLKLKESKVHGVKQPEDEVKEHLEDNQCLKVKKNELVTIAGVDLPKEDVGNAMQLLEFSATFGEILDLEKGQAEAVLRDLTTRRSTRHVKFTSVVQFHIQLLSVIQEKSGSKSKSESSDMTHGNDSWLKALKSCISKSKLKDMDFIDMPAGGYDDLDSSKKLRLLVFLCDEVLGTEKIRNWIDDQNGKFFEKRKEAKDKLGVAKEKEKSLKQKMQDDIVEAIIAKECVPLTIKEHDAIVSKIKDEVAEAHAKMLASKKLVSIDEERPDALRTEQIFKDNNGHVF